MKKVLLLFFAIACAFNAFSQEIDSLHNHSVAIPIDSLYLKIEKLQHDYDFLYCDYELHKLTMDLKDLTHSIDNSSNGVVINIYNSSYSRDLYNTYLEHYDSCSETLDSLKEKIEAVRIAVLLRIASSGFNEYELNVLFANLEYVNRLVTKVDSSLKYYDTTINTYRSKRW